MITNETNPIIDQEGNKRWLNDKGQSHRVGGPAIEYANGDKQWWQNGQHHRIDGPAIEWADGHKEWYLNDQLHRIDGPAVERANGDKAWYQNGQCHRIDGPAIERANGDKVWYQYDQLHRVGGPAIEWANGNKEWWKHGVKINLEIKCQSESIIKYLTAEYGEIELLDKFQQVSSFKFYLPNGEEVFIHKPIDKRNCYYFKNHDEYMIVFFEKSYTDGEDNGMWNVSIQKVTSSNVIIELHHHSIGNLFDEK